MFSKTSQVTDRLISIGQSAGAEKMAETMEAGEILLRRGLLDERQLERSRENLGAGGGVLDAAVELG